MAERNVRAVSLKTLTKSNVWDIQENDVFRMWKAASREADTRDNMRHYIDVLRSAFEMEEVKIDRPEIVKKYEDRGYHVDFLTIDEGARQKWAIKKKAIVRVTDLTYENIRHISARQLLDVIDRNLGGGWGSLSQSIQDIIQTGFDISTTTLPKDRLQKKGGLYEKMVKDGAEVLVIPKGTWVEAIFAKEKPEFIMPKTKIEEPKFHDSDGEDDEDELPEEPDTYGREEEDDEFDDDKLTEESYRTTLETDPEALDLEAADIIEDDDY